MRKSLTKKERIGSGKEIQKLFRSSLVVSTRGAKLFYSENQLDCNRIAVTLVRKYGNAVQRNRAKRVLKEIYRNQKHTISGPFDLLVLLYPGNDNYAERFKQFTLLLQRAGIVKTVE